MKVGTIIRLLSQWVKGSVKEGRQNGMLVGKVV